LTARSILSPQCPDPYPNVRPNASRHYQALDLHPAHPWVDQRLPVFQLWLAFRLRDPERTHHQPLNRAQKLLPAQHRPEIY